MQKKLITAILSAVLVVAMAATVFAGTWKQDEKGWQYDNGNGSLSKSTWQWIDGKCYCFDKDGNMYANTTTPDGYTVNADGAWTVNGTVQTQGTSTAGKSASSTDERLYYFNKWSGLPGESTDVVQAKMLNAVNVDKHSFTDYTSTKYPKPKTYEEYRKFLTSIDWPNMSEMDRLEACFKRCATGYNGNHYAETWHGDTENNVLVYHDGICQDFAQTLEILCTYVGLSSNLYECTTKSHALTEVKVDGIWYTIDPTWAEGQPMSTVMWRSDSPDLAAKWPRSNQRY